MTDDKIKQFVDPYLVQQDIRAVEAKIAEVKGPLRTTWKHDMGGEQIKLRRLRAEATRLYILRAWMRGKLHRRNPPEETRAVFIAQGRDLSEWDAFAHAKKVAENEAERYLPQPSESEDKMPFWKRLFSKRSPATADGV